MTRLPSLLTLSEKYLAKVLSETYGSLHIIETCDCGAHVTERCKVVKALGDRFEI